MSITVEEFLSSATRKITYKKISHQFVQKKGMNKQVCNGCGLVALNNKFTQWCIDKGCLCEEHVGYKAARHRFTKLN